MDYHRSGLHFPEFLKRKAAANASNVAVAANIIALEIQIQASIWILRISYVIHLN